MNDTDLRTRLGDAFLSEAPDAIIACDREGIIRFWNRGAVRIFGFAEHEAVGQTLDIIIPERLRARHWEGYDKMMSSGLSRYGEGHLLSVPGVRKDGSPASIEFTIFAIKDADGRVDTLVAVMRDVTERFDELKALRKQLRERPPG